MQFDARYYLFFLVGLLISLISTPLVIKLAKYNGWVVVPRADRWHKKTTALMGGIAIYFSTITTYLFFAFPDVNYALIVASTIIFIVGLYDDLYEVKPIVKLLAQLICSFILIEQGYIFGGGHLSWVGIPLTFIWIIGVTNAVNLLDNMDGLAAGISFVISVIMVIVGIINNDFQIAGIALCLSGASLGFLFYNFNPAVIFMGDCGSMFLGFMISFLAINIQTKLGSSPALLILLIPITIVAIPIMDTTLVTIRRLISGRRIDQGGRDHTSHRLVALGLSEKKAVILLYIISLIWGGLCLSFYVLDQEVLLPLLFLFGIFSVLFATILSNVKVYSDSEEKTAYLTARGQLKDNNKLIKFVLQNKKLILGLLNDLIIINFSFFAASKIIGVELTDNEILRTVPVFIVSKILIFYFTNIYRRIWKYTATIELKDYLISSVISSIVVAIILIFIARFHSLTASFFVVDSILTFLGLAISRLAIKAMSEYLFLLNDASKATLIYGAGDAGYLLVKELIQNSKYNLKPVVILDDDVSKQKLIINGIPIAGGISVIEKVIKQYKIESLIISIKNLNPDIKNEISSVASRNNVRVGYFSVNLDFDK